MRSAIVLVLVSGLVLVAALSVASAQLTPPKRPTEPPAVGPGKPTPPPVSPRPVEAPRLLPGESKPTPPAAPGKPLPPAAPTKPGELPRGGISGVELDKAPAKPGTPAATENKPTYATIIVSVPANATVWFGDQRMAQTGPRRSYQSPPLESGKNYAYKLKVSWPNGPNQKEYTTEHEVKVQPGLTTEIDFTPLAQPPRATGLPKEPLPQPIQPVSKPPFRFLPRPSK